MRIIYLPLWKLTPRKHVTHNDSPTSKIKKQPVSFGKLRSENDALKGMYRHVVSKDFLIELDYQSTLEQSRRYLSNSLST